MLTASVAVYSIGFTANKEAHRQSQNILALLEKKEYESLAMQSFSQALSTKSENKVRQASLQLQQIESLEDGKIDFWFGSLSETQEKELLLQISQEKKPVKCDTCFDFDKKTNNYLGSIVLASEGVLWFDSEKAIISRNGQANTIEKITGRIGLGASYYANNVSSVFFFGEGFK